MVARNVTQPNDMGWMVGMYLKSIVWEPQNIPYVWKLMVHSLFRAKGTSLCQDPGCHSMNPWQDQCIMWFLRLSVSTKMSRLDEVVS